VKSQHVEVEGLTAHYVVAGRGPALVLLHGGANDWREWEENIGALSQKLEVYALDLPGFGLTPKPEARYTLNFLANFVHGFMQAVGLSYASLGGHSLGAGVALKFALRFPDRVERLILVDAWGFGRVTLLGWLIVTSCNLFRRVFQPGRFYPFLEKEPGQGNHWLSPEELRKLEVPALIVWGERDLYLPVAQAHRAHQLLPNSELFIFQGCGHAPQRERREEFNQVVLKFLLSGRDEASSRCS